MKLVVQIPCYNEEQTIAQTVRDIPRYIADVDGVEVLIIDDGSEDATVERALAAGADHVISFTANKGLAAAFAAGLEASVQRGADIIVHTDADNQYKGDCIPALIQPILRGEADIVVGTRPIESTSDFSWLKKKLQRAGSWVVRHVSGTDIADATSGFRAYSRETAMQLNVVSDFTYTLETLIQAGRSNVAVAQVPIETNRQTRPSRLFKGIPQYTWRSLHTLFRIYALYEPLRFFTTIGLLLFLPGLALAARFLYYFLSGNGSGHVQSLILAAVLMLLGFQIVVVGLLADLIGANRKLLQTALLRLKRQTGVRPEPPTRFVGEDKIRELRCSGHRR